ncbi:hypothetical protein NF27_JN00060 [Candidatus Jidaibacter acanthamoeba]|uniref:Uncharacterized protein n=1 Tax=Candidatus Jidaibacter acanthamoebae TaxID=86105 RepID=A0A0C1QVR7_9RICK|nr:hypothetical protein NF27_JN00060 [Candidatus Jidaibacter acanthamoeba]
MNLLKHVKLFTYFVIIYFAIIVIGISTYGMIKFYKIPIYRSSNLIASLPLLLWYLIGIYLTGWTAYSCSRKAKLILNNSK